MRKYKNVRKKNYLKLFRLMTAKGRIENEQKSREIENLFAEPECDEVTIFGENTGGKSFKKCIYGPNPTLIVR